MIYLDNSATTAPCDAARDALCDALSLYNPSSLHGEGQRSAAALAASRAVIAASLGASPREIVFTPSGSSANNLAIFGTIAEKRGRIIISASEHPSVSACGKELARRGCELCVIPSVGGCVDISALLRALTPDTLLVSVMLVNNETGAINAVDKIRPLLAAHAPRAKLHIDAVQGFLKLPFTAPALGCDLLTVSAHKVYAPRGAAALYIKAGQRLSPLILGGGQEQELVSGTENTAAICAFAAAVEAGRGEIIANFKKAEALRALAIERLSPLGIVNTPTRALPNIISFTLAGVRSETLLHFLEARGICISSGSACSSHKKGPSPALLDFGLTPDLADSTVRISTGQGNTEEEILTLCAAISDAKTALKPKRMKIN